MVEISTEIVHKSLASVAASTVPNSYVYDNPNQQGTHLPAWFIVHREPVRIERENQRRAWIIFGIDLYYMIELNTPRVFDEYARVGDALDCALTYLQIYGTDKLVHVFERSWELAMNCLKYSLTLRLRCAPDIIEPPKMEVIEDLQVFLKSLGKLKRIRYICTQFSDFDMGIETSQYCRVGDSVVLPFVGGIYRDGDNTRWEPLSWNVGPFGGQYGPITDDVTIDLVMGVVVGFDVCIGGTVGVGSNLGSDIVWRLADMSKDAWHYVGPELVLGDVIVIGGDDLSRDAYEYGGPQKNLGPSPVLGGTVEPYSQGGTDTVTGTISSLALPSAHSGSYTGVSFDSLRYYAKGTLSNIGIRSVAFGMNASWCYATITWNDPSLGDLSSRIAIANPSGGSTEFSTKQTVFRIIFITDGNITGYHPYDTEDVKNTQGQITEYTYINGTHSITFCMANQDWAHGPYAGRIQFRYLDGTTTFNNLDAFDLVDVSSGTLSKTTTTDRYDMYIYWGGDLTLKADYE